MKTFIIVLIIGVSVLFAAQSFACHIEFDTANLQSVAVGDIVTIEAVVIKEHRRCVLPDDEVNVELSDNLKIVNESGWQTVGDEIHNTLQIQVLSAGESRLRVFRECSKKGISEGTFEFWAVS